MLNQEIIDSILESIIPCSNITNNAHPLFTGWTGRSRVYLGYDVTNDKYVAIKVKDRLRAANEARILQYLTGVDNIPIFYGALAMTNKDLIGLVTELITDGTNSKLTYIGS